MTRHELIELAQECGIDINANDTFSTSRESQYWVEAGYFDIERFAALVAAAEREACAKVCDDVAAAWSQTTTHISAFDCAAVIRSRNNT